MKNYLISLFLLLFTVSCQDKAKPQIQEQEAYKEQTERICQENLEECQNKKKKGTLDWQKNIWNIAVKITN